jgi:hypothetical protein
VELAVALTALKAMEVLRPEVGERLTLWVAAAGGGRRAAGEEFGRRQAEVLGELRAQYANHLRRAVGGVAAAGPSLLGALRNAALNPPTSSSATAASKNNSQRGGGLYNRHNRDGDSGNEYGDGNGNGNGQGNGHGNGDYGHGGGGGREGDEGEGASGGGEEAASLDELDALVAPVIAHIQTVVSGLRRSIPQRRALVGVLRGLWDHLGGEALKFVEEDLR